MYVQPIRKIVMQFPLLNNCLKRSYGSRKLKGKNGILIVQQINSYELNKTKKLLHCLIICFYYIPPLIPRLSALSLLLFWLGKNDANENQNYNILQ